MPCCPQDQLGPDMVGKHIGKVQLDVSLIIHTHSSLTQGFVGGNIRVDIDDPETGQHIPFGGTGAACNSDQGYSGKKMFHDLSPST